jgi:hypothetical protein
MDVFGRMNAVLYQYSTTSIMQKSSTSSSLMPWESVSDRINLRSSTVPVPDANAASMTMLRPPRRSAAWSLPCRVLICCFVPCSTFQRETRLEEGHLSTSGQDSRVAFSQEENGAPVDAGSVSADKRSQHCRIGSVNGMIHST